MIVSVLQDNLHWLIHYPITKDHRGLETAVLGLQFIATRDHFSSGSMRLKCKAQIGNLYYQSQETVVLHTNYLQRKQESSGYSFHYFFYSKYHFSKNTPTIFRNQSLYRKNAREKSTSRRDWLNVLSLILKLKQRSKFISIK